MTEQNGFIQSIIPDENIEVLSIDPEAEVIDFNHSRLEKVENLDQLLNVRNWKKNLLEFLNSFIRSGEIDLSAE